MARAKKPSAPSAPTNEKPQAAKCDYCETQRQVIVALKAQLIHFSKNNVILTKALLKEQEHNRAQSDALTVYRQQLLDQLTQLTTAHEKNAFPGIGFHWTDGGWKADPDPELYSLHLTWHVGEDGERQWKSEWQSEERIAGTELSLAT
jgi:hypothetical protein